ncbi:MAG: 4'-phosphopantetheinyl transferase superfamily protein [Bacteroidota bacterium]
MVGNDIIDLQLANKESNWQRPRFLEKLFTEQEQDFIRTAPNPTAAVWTLWSQKESAYKIIVRLEKRRFYAPKKLTTTVPFDLSASSSSNVGQVTFASYNFLTKSKITDAYIHTTAQLNDYQSLMSDSFQLAQSNCAYQRTTTRFKLLQAYATKNSLSLDNLSIQKDEWKVPHLYYKNQRQTVQISMAHHGYFGGYVLQKF